jgi:hypothetical protein
MLFVMGNVPRKPRISSIYICKALTEETPDDRDPGRQGKAVPLPAAFAPADESDPSERSRASPEKAKRAFVLGASRGARDATRAGSVKARGWRA